MPGTTDTGNHCDDCSTVISLPFSVTLYGTRPSRSCNRRFQRHFTFGTDNNALPALPARDPSRRRTGRSLLP